MHVLVPGLCLPCHVLCQLVLRLNNVLSISELRKNAQNITQRLWNVALLVSKYICRRCSECRLLW